MAVREEEEEEQEQEQEKEQEEEQEEQEEQEQDEEEKSLGSVHDPTGDLAGGPQILSESWIRHCARTVFPSPLVQVVACVGPGRGGWDSVISTVLAVCNAASPRCQL